jgi:hypothetical protein
MALPNLYSRRKRLAEKQGDDVYQYHRISSKLRNQILFILEEWDRKLHSSGVRIAKTTVEMMRQELGETCLSNGYPSNDAEELRYSASQSYGNAEQYYEDGVSEMNARMLEDGFGFQIENGQAIQISSTFIHKEVTIPALGLLSSAEYKPAEEEFRQAYSEFNLGNFDDCIHDCCNAFESVLKIILTNKGWSFDPNDPARKLLAVAFDNTLIPSYMQNEFNGLRTILESGVPTVRNKDGGHGAGVNPRNIPKHIAAFQLHQTAAAIVLLVEAAK